MPASASATTAPPSTIGPSATEAPTFPALAEEEVAEGNALPMSLLGECPASQLDQMTHAAEVEEGLFGMPPVFKEVEEADMVLVFLTAH